MKHVFLRQSEGASGLLLFFSGWGAEPCMFREGATDESAAYDILMLWDYRDMSFDARILSGYKEVRVLAWSMGVWAAGQVLSQPGLNGCANGIRLAVNGTPFPVHNRMGIPEAVFDGTLATLSDRSLGKFRRRMCGSSEAMEQLMSCGLHRTVDELREELSAIREAVRHGADHDAGTFSGTAAADASGEFSWNHAVIGSGDLIFPAANQTEAWKGLDVPVTLLDIPHYDSSLFRRLLYKEDSWTNI